jgi:hypothetical protein
MQDQSNPTAAEIRRWAADPESLCPMQDWDLVITGIGFKALFLDLLEETDCPKADFFLHCLYLWVYDTVRVESKIVELEPLLRRGEASKEQSLRIWARRSRNLIANPRRAEKDLWWGFGQNRSNSGHG